MGALDSCEWREGSLRVAGWSLSPQGPVSGLALDIDETCRVKLGPPALASPDVARVWPRMPGAAACRFHAEIACDERDIADSLVSVTPMVQGMRGIPLERYWPLRFPLPSTATSERVGGGDFVHTSFEFLSIFRHLAALQPDEAVLDAGCGLGRIAYGLAHYLSAEARYEGFDVSADLIAMARSRFAPLENFHFRHVDVANAMYNPHGRVRAADFAFPLADGEFDFAFLTS
ncbi:MAG TPA: class I SAM-dependent methyltransferase, partial [Usitatibacter sp.]|nr:class I SAM-dependent methyltransferase [Usitatibacter sp.]